MTSNALTWRAALLALAVVAVWGTNFVVIKVALADLPPLLFATLRFTFALLPAVLFLRKPDVPWRNLAAYGVLIGLGQFGMLYIAMQHDISPGLASLVVQVQVFFTIGLSMWLTRERVKRFQVAALVLATAGLAIILLHTDGSTTPLGLGLVLIAAASWAGGNMVQRATPGVNSLAYVVWASLFSIPPLLILSLVFEGPQRMLLGVQNADLATWGAVLWQSVGNTLFGYAAWGWLLARYPAATISPLAFFVPVFGMAASAVLLNEPMQDWKLTAAGLVLGGLALNMFWPMLRRRAPQAS
ncbi:MAG: EamA family transporter [Phenylobacterium sp.]|uniref:EamA family transporter n=2 Tax=Phenylobacterium sp. TaxID=1871053 RepID=UPI00271E9BFA|nr:EamA family transporter [Phenylobacterium sp.]MDO8910286.1 EamA family transporter [Phenylobacterium sp.]MDP3102816.1 EamA family transporter [Phenylobacterium sp.]MDP3635088.1 EamA family transporter [Phenylobacterium sp.]MDP3868964.1 EamA family transporter [Phenylobacterium sp.]MDZ4054315.1 EamA family transporter [Phenylobacterium sp.]